MNVHKVARAAEWLQIAGRMLEEAAQAVEPLAPALRDPTLADLVAELALQVNIVWAALVGEAGEEYVRSLLDEKDQTAVSARKLGEVMFHIAKMGGDELADLIADEKFVYREVAKRIAQARLLMGFEQPGLLSPANGLRIARGGG